MKAITCTQCGALIKRISLKNKFAFCDYCEAKILLEDNKDRIVELPDKKEKEEKPLSAWEQYKENVRKVNERTKQNNDAYTYPQDTETNGSKFAGFIVVTILVIIVIGGFIAILAGLSPRPKTNTQVTTPRASSSPVFNFSTPKPTPQINYEVKVQWSGNYDMEHMENPQIDTSKLPTTDVNELKKTVFKNRAAQVRVTINTEGEVVAAEGISGHPVLLEAAVNAAKKTLFNSRQRQTTRVLTYYFRLLTD